MIIRPRRLKYWAPVLTIALLVGGAATSNCALKSGRTPEGLLAQYGGSIGKTVKVSQDAVGQIGTALGIPLPVRQGAVKALEGLDKVNDNGIKLAAALKRISAARAASQTPTPTDFQEALELVNNIDENLVFEVIPQLNTPEARAALTSVREISKLILNIQLELGGLR